MSHFTIMIEAEVSARKVNYFRTLQFRTIPAKLDLPIFMKLH